MAHKILVADDSPTIRNVAQSLLRKHGYEVLSAQDGAEALRVARSGRPDIVFLGDSMPVMEGEQVLKELKHDPELKDVPVIMLLSRDQADTRQRLKQLGTDSFIAKPLNPAQILTQAERLLSQRKLRPSAEARPDHGSIAPEVFARTDRVEHVEVTLPGGEEKPGGILDFVANSDLVKSGDSSLIASDEDAAHGFEWFLDELKRETHDKKASAPAAEVKTTPEEREIPKASVPPGKDNQSQETDDGEQGFEEFVKELKYNEGQPDDGQAPRVERSIIEGMSPSHFDQLISSLTERIPRRVAREVAEMVTPELLERIVREELARMRRDSS